MKKVKYTSMIPRMEVVMVSPNIALNMAENIIVIAATMMIIASIVKTTFITPMLNMSSMADFISRA